MSVRDHADKLGIAGAALAALCCLGAAAVVSFVAAIGLGFLVNDAVLLPLMIASIVVMMWAMAASWRRHHRASALILTSLAAAGLFVATFVLGSRSVAYASIAALIAASVLNARLTRHVTSLKRTGGHNAAA